jgi:hypothetical protein
MTKEMAVLQQQNEAAQAKLLKLETLNERVAMR